MTLFNLERKPTTSPSPFPLPLLTALRRIRAHSPYSLSLHLSNLPRRTTASDLEAILDKHVPSYITDGGAAVGIVRNGVTMGVGRGGERGTGGLRMVRLYEAPNSSLQEGSRGTASVGTGGDAGGPVIAPHSQSHLNYPRSSPISTAGTHINPQHTTASSTRSSSLIICATNTVSCASGSLDHQTGPSHTRYTSGRSDEACITVQEIKDDDDDDADLSMIDDPAHSPSLPQFTCDTTMAPLQDDAPPSSMRNPIPRQTVTLCAELIFDSESHHYLAKHVFSRLTYDGHQVQAHTRRWRLGHAWRRMISA